MNTCCCVATASGGVFQLIASSLILQQDPQPQSVQDVRFVLEVDGDAAEAFVEFRPAGSDEGDQVRLRLVRNRQLDPPATGWELHTGPTGLPCQLALSWLPELERLGTECTFQGSVWSERMATGWEADISGVFRQLDLDRLITGHFPHKLSGISELMLGRADVASRSDCGGCGATPFCRRCRESVPVGCRRAPPGAATCIPARAMPCCCDTANCRWSSPWTNTVWQLPAVVSQMEWCWPIPRAPCLPPTNRYVFRPWH